MGVKSSKLAGWGKNDLLALLANAQDAISPGRLEELIPALTPLTHQLLDAKLQRKPHVFGLRFADSTSRCSRG
jgi:hypothetical protein